MKLKFKGGGMLSMNGKRPQFCTMSFFKLQFVILLVLYKTGEGNGINFLLDLNLSAWGYAEV